MNKQLEKALNGHDIEFDLSNIYDGDKRIVVKFNSKIKRNWWSQLFGTRLNNQNEFKNCGKLLKPAKI